MGISLYFKVRKFAKKNGFRGARYLQDWKGYKVYEPYMRLTKISYIGLPQLILVNEQQEVRMATPTEVGIILFNEENTFVKTEEELRQDQIEVAQQIELEKKEAEQVEIEKAKIKKILSEDIDSKVVNQLIELYYKDMTNCDPQKDYLSLPVLVIDDLKNIRLRSIITNEADINGMKGCYCFGYIEKDYDSLHLPKENFFDSPESCLNDMTMLRIPKGEYSDIGVDQLKSKYYDLLNQLKSLVIKNEADITVEESKIIKEYLLLYRYLEREEVQAYQSLHNNFFIWCLVNSRQK